MAFVSSVSVGVRQTLFGGEPSRNTFVGTKLSGPAYSLSPHSVTARYTPDKYAKYSSGSSQPAPEPSKPSGIWKQFIESAKLRNAPYPSTMGKKNQPIRPSTPYYNIRTTARMGMYGKGGDPETLLLKTGIERLADGYMANCITSQYKMTAVSNGVYSTQCTEGTTKFQAEDSRVAALGADFRMKQRTTSQKFADMYESRNRAITLAHGCGYEEKMLCKYTISTRTYIRAQSEAQGNCARYITGGDAGEKYMASSVEKQYKMLAVPFGVYDVRCNDGTAKGLAEFKRVQALSAKYRAMQLPALKKEAGKFDAKKYARDNFAHMCSYEEELFNKFAPVAAYMRPLAAARY